jgi:hypothetical protein
MHVLARTLTAVIVAATIACALASPRASAQSPTWRDWQSAAEPEAYKILQYLDGEGTDTLVVVGAGRQQGLLAGTALRVYRAAVSPSGGGEPVWVETGRLKVKEVQDGVTIATVDTQSTTMSKAFFPKFPGVMAGDLVVAQRLVVSRRQTLLPSTALVYADLFQDPKAEPASFELKASGLEALRAAAQVFAAARVSLLMVEGYTDSAGSSQANQVESYQRALTVRQYLIDELGFDERRVVAVGYGETDPADQSRTPGAAGANRRIVLKALPLQGTGAHLD